MHPCIIQARSYVTKLEHTYYNIHLLGFWRKAGLLAVCASGLYNCKSSLPGPCRRHLPWQCCTEESRQSVLQRQSPEHGLGRPAKKGHWKEIAPSECHTLRC